MPRRVLLLDAPQLQTWREGPHRFAEVAQALVRSGHAVTLASVGAEPAPAAAGLSAVQVEPPAMPLICGSGRASHARALRDAYAVAARFGGETFDNVIAPLHGGLAFGLLMQRATGERNISRSIALWCDTAARWRALHDDAAISVGTLMEDALERASLRLADALVAPHGGALARAESLGEALPPVLTGVLPPFGRTADAERHAPERAGDIVFAGPLTRRGGALAFMDALERLASAGHLDGRRVTFVGPATETPRGVGLATLGLRATQWPFRFDMRGTHDPRAALAVLQDHPGLVVCLDPDDDRLARTLRACGRRVIAGPMDADALGAAILEGAPAAAGADETGGTAWAELLERLPARAEQAPVRPAASLCIATRGRPDALKRAVRSVTQQACAGLEILIADNAGDTPLDAGTLGIPPQVPARVVRFDALVPQGSALNTLAGLARGEVLVFFDDDNLLLAGGLGRFLDAVAPGRFDVAVTPLELVDGDAASGVPAGRHMFAGDPGMAGLFFNGFGDTSLAIRREAFQRIGGFAEPGHQHAALDWILLARARTLGLRIGVLIEPAVRYSRRIGLDERNWRKHDLEGARHAVAEAYGAAIDAPLLARFAQSLHLDAD